MEIYLQLFPQTELQYYHPRRAEGLNVLKHNYSVGRTSLSYTEGLLYGISYQSHINLQTAMQALNKDLKKTWPD